MTAHPHGDEGGQDAPDKFEHRGRIVDQQSRQITVRPFAPQQRVSAHTLLDRPAYRALADAGIDECGLTTLAGRTVGAPFVGAVTAAVAVADLLRMALGAHRYEVVDCSLPRLEHRQAVRVSGEAAFNPGSARTA